MPEAVLPYEDTERVRRERNGGHAVWYLVSRGG